VFFEKDIPIQVAIGNYDLGICGLDWVEELMTKYPSSAIVKLQDLDYGHGALYIVASRSAKAPSLEAILRKRDIIRLASEYPNLAESLALEQRLRRFSIFPLWGAVEVYPPENADLALISGGTVDEIFKHDLVPINCVLNYSACLIANRSSWGTKDLSLILASLEGKTPAKQECPAPAFVVSAAKGRVGRSLKFDESAVCLALPDGHQQQPTIQLLNKAGIRVNDYPSATGNRRPTTSLSGVTIKVIRPQDMPLQVANGNFDLAITGRDWLADHLSQFPSSPVTELLDLKSGKVKIVAVVNKDLPVSDAFSLRQFYSASPVPIRVASEYVNIADKYARDNHLGMYRIVPTWGASEAFIPEDADLLIENTETGRTIARHNLKIIDTLFESTACLIGYKNGTTSRLKSGRIKLIIETLRKAVEV
jgi:ATP phosphoribosyltransferase